MIFKGKKILLGVTGSIAAYKSVVLLRLLTAAGAEVKIIMTEAAKDFVTPLTFSTLSGHQVLDKLFDEQQWSNHVMLGRWADIMIIAPVSCNTLAKIANGFCDNLLLATYLSSTCPVLMAPAMDGDMWNHPSTKSNIEKIKSFGNTVLPVSEGLLASGLTGPGRMPEPEEIFNYLKDFFFDRSLLGKKALVTAGPTHEALDPVRFIGNRASGKMGVALAEELYRRGAEVTLIIGPSLIKIPSEIHTINITSAEEMYTECKSCFAQMDIMIMAAAVADYTPVTVETQKMKKKEDVFHIDLQKTHDILKAAGEVKRQDQMLVGFALETNNSEENAINKLKNKKADFIVLNTLQEGAGFETDTNKITIFAKDGSRFPFNNKSKKLVAKDILDTIINHHHA